MYIIGLTGLIAAGKSSVAALLAARGALVIDCDALAREVVEPRTPGLAAVAERFGVDMLCADGSLNRAALGALVFSDPVALAALEAITHPLIAERREELLAASSADVAVVEAIKLFEAGFAQRCDAVWVVSAPRAVRLARLVGARGLSEAAAQARLAAQADEADLLARADLVLVNDGSRAQLERRVAAAWATLPGPARV